MAAIFRQSAGYVCYFRHRNEREAREKRLFLTKETPAKVVDKYLQQIETQAALKIQTQWRGYHTKKQFDQQRQGMKRLKAIITLQRYNLTTLYKTNQILTELCPELLIDEFFDIILSEIQQKLTFLLFRVSDSD